MTKVRIKSIEGDIKIDNMDAGSVMELLEEYKAGVNVLTLDIDSSVMYVNRENVIWIEVK